MTSGAAPGSSRSEGATVQVWFADPAPLAEGPAREAARALLTGPERDHVDRLRFERDRAVQLAARALLRRALSRGAAAVPAPNWRFEPAPGGKPAILSPPSAIRFNVSHTAGLVAVALADVEVGVDVEGVPARLPRDVVDRSFAPEERDAVLADPGRATARFAEIWTLKEAYAKARGLGLALPFDSFAVAADPARLVRADQLGWRLWLVPAAPSHRAAVCVQLPGPARVEVHWDDLTCDPGSLSAGAPRAATRPAPGSWGAPR